MPRKPQPDNHPIQMREVHVGADIEADALELGKAIEAYKNRRYRPYPTWSEVLEVAISIGYRKVAPPSTPIRPEPTTSRQRSDVCGEVQERQADPDH